MGKSYKGWLQCFYLFFIAVLLYKFCVEISAMICDGEEKTFLKSYIFESLLVVISLIVIHRYRLVIFRNKINIPLVLIGVLALIGFQVIVSLINGSDGDGTDLLLEKYKVIAFPTIVVLGPIAEELFFRGVIYSLLEKETDLIIIPLVISSGMFAIFHMGWVASIYNFFSGIIFALLYKKEESIWNNIVCHMVMNLIVFLVQTLL